MKWRHRLMISLDELAQQFHAFETVDKINFQREARILQSIWRHEKGYPIGEHTAAGTKRLLGSRLPVDFAVRTLANFLNPNIRELVKNEVLEPIKRREKLYSRPRIFNDLLSSQPLCFNLFGELKLNPTIAVGLLKQMVNQDISQVTCIEFEYSPGRRSRMFTDDRSAFDIYMEYAYPDSRKGFVGIEVKYHENLKTKKEQPGQRHYEIAEKLGCFKAGQYESLAKQPLMQIWRDHLLAGSILQNLVHTFNEGYFVFLYPKGNTYCAEAVNAYKQFLKNEDTFLVWFMEDVVSHIRRVDNRAWITEFADRYLNFDKLTGYRKS